ncbi:TPA: hypothetical protein ACYFBF_003340 [Klebsiella pneumoniae]|uniref:hypothetical protein n=1 Tax=Klebsiella pneumoniae TaxID=573 RepID=UPI000B9C4888|nr:hypothetical protein [Klebsiella pneumoniae]AWA69284.1 hypothetical protein B7D49_19785 [Klebsiella pneumoniae]EKX6965126.1 hypothetical protein [Klebsiella pneumoniae]MCB3011223.1 hypothetical protein [Klebsiella pneumoniae]MCB3212101.1 hypothetical protein [Klebsiella pneumoniae]MCB3223813.1 hypothetical protein [Klebsiella pneumoniae]
MKKIVVALIIVIVIGSVLFFEHNSKQSESKGISYIQCVVVDAKIHDCTDITDFKILKTESMDGYKKHN